MRLTPNAANAGRGLEVNHFFNYMRAVDYISAACIMFRKDTFTKVPSVHKALLYGNLCPCRA